MRQRSSATAPQAARRSTRPSLARDRGGSAAAAGAPGTHARCHAFFAADFQVLSFAHGQSNPTYLLKLGVGSSQARFVLRKKPPGKLLASAHAVDREHAVLQVGCFLLPLLPLCYYLF